MARPRLSKVFANGARVTADNLGAVAESQHAGRLASRGGDLRDRSGREIGALQGKGASSWRYRDAN